MTNKERLNRLKTGCIGFTQEEYQKFVEPLYEALEILEEIKENHPDLYKLYKAMKEAEKRFFEND